MLAGAWCVVVRGGGGAGGAGVDTPPRASAPACKLAGQYALAVQPKNRQNKILALAHRPFAVLEAAACALDAVEHV